MVTPGKTTVATAECDHSQGRNLIYTDSQYEQGPVYLCLSLNPNALGKAGLFGLDH